MNTVTFPLTNIATSRKKYVPDHILSLDDDDIMNVITKITGHKDISDISDIGRALD